ncbi:hypothetical protein ACFU8I_09440 [Streptomyces sp. NPDC057540]|uniref:hypothetical protein n=1 Tax=Streptomyces sp. NPDC057540 TaxID=3346160 RepID=UPI0036747EC5
MTVRRSTATLLAGLFAATLLTAPAQAQSDPAPDDVAAAVAAHPEGQWLNCHPHSFKDWCPILGPGWHQLLWQYCDSIWGKQEYCVPTPAPAPAPAVLPPGD